MSFISFRSIHLWRHITNGEIVWITSSQTHMYGKAPHVLMYVLEIWFIVLFSYSLHIVADCGTTGRRWITLLFYVSLSKTCPMRSVERVLSPCQFVWNGRGRGWVFFCQLLSWVLSWASPVWFSILVHLPGRLSHRTSSTCQTITPKIHRLQDLSTCKLCWR